MLGPQQERPRPNFSNMPGMEMDLGNSRIGGEFNIDAGPGLGGAVKKSQMERALETGDSAGLLAGYGAGLGGPQKSMAPRPASPAPTLGSPGRTMVPGRPAGPAMAPPVGWPGRGTPGQTSVGVPGSGAMRRAGSGAERQGDRFWNGTSITPQQQAQWAGPAGSRVGTSPMGGSQSWASGSTNPLATQPGGPPSMGTMTAPAPPPAMSFSPGTATGSLPPMGPPGAPSNNAALVAAAVRSGALQKLPGESLDQAVMRILSKMGEGGNLAAARASGGGDSVIRNSLGGM